MIHPRALAAALLLVACDDPAPSSSVDAAQIEGAWVFSYAQPQTFSMDALHVGPAVVVDGCLQIGDAVVVWEAVHLGDVEEILARTADGEALTVTLGGGGRSVAEGDSLADLPAEITDRCAPAVVWFAGPDAPTIE